MPGLLGLGASSSTSSGDLGDITGALSGAGTPGLTSGATTGLVDGLAGAATRRTSGIKARQDSFTNLLGLLGINLGGTSTSDLGALAGAGTTGLNGGSTTGLVDELTGAATSLSSGGTGFAGAPRHTNTIRGLLDSSDSSNQVNDLLAPAEGIASVAGGTDGLQFIKPLFCAVEGAGTLLTPDCTSASTIASRDMITKSKRQSDSLGDLTALLSPSALSAILGGVPGLSGLAGLLSGLGSSGSSGS